MLIIIRSQLGGETKLKSEIHQSESVPPPPQEALTRELKVLMEKLDAIDSMTADLTAEYQSGHYAGEEDENGEALSSELFHDTGKLELMFRHVQRLLDTRTTQILDTQRDQHEELLQALSQIERRLREEIAEREQQSRDEIIET